MSAATRAYIEHRALLIDDELRARLPVSDIAGTDRLNLAIHSALFPGGKRMRPFLVLLSAEICGADPRAALPVACAVEFLHAASLVMDDLPAMDDASLRRGRPTLHITYGDDIALLAALALLNESYALFAATPSLLPLAVREIGASGMIGGQAVDVSGARHRGRLEKTTALTRLTMAAGALAARASAHHTDVLIQFGDALGEAYQICDDIVDALDTGAASGKTSNQDFRNERCNCLHQLGHTAAVERVADLIESSTTRLRHCFGPTPQTAMLEDFARVLVTRTLNLVENDPALALAGMSGSGLVERPQLAGS